MLVVLAAVALAVAGSASPQEEAGGADPYRGLGTWVDIYDGGLYRNPPAAVRGMKRRGVRTLYIETANFSQSVDIVKPKSLGRFIESAHAAGIQVVAWYLPGFASYSRDLRRSLAAVRFRTPRGQRFDSFGLDIESSDVRNVKLRNSRLLRLSNAIRRAAGAGYPLGAIIPSPRGMQLLPKYWPGFPYAALAEIYDAFLPMGYYSYRTRTLRGAYDYTVRNVAIIRRRTGDPEVPIHLIGGVADSSTTAQARGFVRAARECGVIGASLYDFGTTTAAHWSSLNAVKRPPAATRDC